MEVNVSVHQVTRASARMPRSKVYLHQEAGRRHAAHDAEAFLRLLESDVQKWARVVKSSGARID